MGLARISAYISLLMAHLRVDPESQRVLEERLNSPEGSKSLDDLLRVIAAEVVEGWLREGRKEPTLEEAQEELRAAVLRTLSPPSGSATGACKHPKKDPQ